jgi:hypothetical protein
VFPVVVKPRDFIRLRLTFNETIHVVPAKEAVPGTFRLQCVDKVSRAECYVPIHGKGAIDLTERKTDPYRG